MVVVDVGPCPLCGLDSIIEVRDIVLAEDIVQWRAMDPVTRPAVQQMFPEQSADFRELVLTGAHPRCYDALEPQDDYDENDEEQDEEADE